MARYDPQPSHTVCNSVVASNRRKSGNCRTLCDSSGRVHKCAHNSKWHAVDRMGSMRDERWVRWEHSTVLFMILTEENTQPSVIFAGNPHPYPIFAGSDKVVGRLSRSEASENRSAGSCSYLGGPFCERGDACPRDFLEIPRLSEIIPWNF